jgi:hypothetical protein
MMVPGRLHPDHHHPGVQPTAGGGDQTLELGQASPIGDQAHAVDHDLPEQVEDVELVGGRWHRRLRRLGRHARDPRADVETAGAGWPGVAASWSPLVRRAARLAANWPTSLVATSVPSPWPVSTAEGVAVHGFEAGAGHARGDALGSSRATQRGRPGRAR